MYRELLSEGAYDDATEYALLLEFARDELEEEIAKEEYEREEYERECLIKESDDKYISIGVTDDCNYEYCPHCAEKMEGERK